MKYHVSNVLAQCLACSIYPINVSSPCLIPPPFSVNVEQKIGNLPASGPSLVPAFINKALLKHNYGFHLHLIYGCFLATRGELRGEHRDYMALYRISLLSLDVEH